MVYRQRASSGSGSQSVAPSSTGTCPMPPLSVVSVSCEVSHQNMVKLVVLIRQFVDLFMRLVIFRFYLRLDSAPFPCIINPNQYPRSNLQLVTMHSIQVHQKLWLRIQLHLFSWINRHLWPQACSFRSWQAHMLIFEWGWFSCNCKTPILSQSSFVDLM
jgi:hypothetical protein